MSGQRIMRYQNDILMKKSMSDIEKQLNEQAEIVKLFKGRCVRCQRVYDTIHECIPRSQGIDSMRRENRVLICAKCHDWAHRVGTKVSAPILQDAREKRLEQYYGNNEEKNVS